MKLKEGLDGSWVPHKAWMTMLNEVQNCDVPESDRGN